MASTSGSTFRTGGAGWWLTLVIAIGATAGLLGTTLGVELVWVAVAAGLVAGVLPHQLERRSRRRRGSAPAQRA